ncbi:hypothetical protein NOJ05_14025 [Neorhizobium galegae]|uniref:hypothetical protein n=1 Tax=Neorhizobium galegae TaxID=399 RepID=UPI0006222DF3|nr:hypothetical protein [Neorhizobium galegae]MCQ1778320.1 hypothetical protein [Neorhizobium galegae]MCQ1796706.1 hypothetical protein [Neorhizobium galegae]CDZ27997.1 Hypothetical protein NGAL_HAMBI490_28500 [Neorhizobium galegae bv. officinalis]
MIRSIYKLALILSVLVPSAAAASFIGNYARWKEMAPVQQSSYLLGVVDSSITTSIPGEPAWMKPLRTGLDSCMGEQQIKGDMLVDLVNSHYTANKADWRISPAIVVMHALLGVCLADVNSEREKAGYQPWDRKPAQISP